MKLNWKFVVTVAAIFAIVFVTAASLAFQASSLQQGAIAKIDPHAVPLDFADEDVRSTLGWLSSPFRPDSGLETVSRTCHSDKEIYRLMLFPGYGGGEYFAIDLTISGNTARVVKRKAGGEIASTKLIDMHEADSVRDEASRLLLSGARVGADPPPPDVSEWTVEMCSHGRYHFFQRYAPEYVTPRDEHFLTFANRMKALMQL